MKISSAKFTLILIGWLALFGVALSDARREVWAAQGDSSVESSAEARKRWDSLTPEAQQRLRKRFERLQSLDEAERAELTRRSKKLKGEEQQLLKRLSPEHRRRLEQQPPDKRRQLLAEMVEEERRNRGARIESKLPKKTRDWLRDAPPEERGKRLARFREQTRERISSRAVEGLAKSLGYGPEEIKRLERLPLDDRMKTIMNLRRKLDEQQLTADDFLEGFTKELWSDLEALPPEEYFTEVLRIRHQGGLRHLSPYDREERLDRREARARERELTRTLRKHLAVSPDEFVDLSTLSHEERKREITSRRRERLLATMKEFEALTEEQLQTMSELPDEDFFQRARAIANGWQGARSGKGEPKSKGSQQ